MHDTSLRVMNMVRRTLLESPEVSDRTLYAAAIAMEPTLGQLSLRQFQARYPRRVRRRELGERASNAAQRATTGRVPIGERPHVYDPGEDTLSPPRSEGLDQATSPAVETAVHESTQTASESSQPWPLRLIANEADAQPAGRSNTGRSPRERAGRAKQSSPEERSARRRRHDTGVQARISHVDAGSSTGRQASGSEPSANALTRSEIRSVLLAWAREIANADTRGELVAVIARADEFVEKIEDLLMARLRSKDLKSSDNLPGAGSDRAGGSRPQRLGDLCRVRSTPADSMVRPLLPGETLHTT
jgi:hypothetical protein